MGFHGFCNLDLHFNGLKWILIDFDWIVVGLQGMQEIILGGMST